MYHIQHLAEILEIVGFIAKQYHWYSLHGTTCAVNVDPQVCVVVTSSMSEERKMWNIKIAPGVVHVNLRVNLRWCKIFGNTHDDLKKHS